MHLVCIVFYNEFNAFALKLTTVTHFEHRAIKIIVFYNDFETLISECVTVSSIWLPYWARGRVLHLLLLVFYNDFNTFALKVDDSYTLETPR